MRLVMDALHVDLMRALSTTEYPVVCTHLRDMPVVLFGGTRNARDLVDDLDVRMLEYTPGARVHRGMMARTRRLWDDGVHDFVSLCAPTPVVLAGWSLGGSCAVQTAALVAAARLPLPRQVCIAGAPRCADRGFAAWYARHDLARRTVRYELSGDPI